jgi:hypothetical protein
MSKTAKLKKDNRSGKWIATYEGQLIMQSINPEHIRKTIANGKCNKANALGITSVIEAGEVPAETTTKDNVPERFNVNERFDFLTDLVVMVADRTSPSLVVTGEGGLGKTYTVNHSLMAAGMQNTADMVGYGSDDNLLPTVSRKLYSVIKGYSSAKGLYRSLFENRHRVIVFDDCDSVLRDPTALQLLKGALDSYDKRIISWNVDSGFGDDDLPRSFEFKGGIIFISNLPLHKVDQAVRSRSLCVDLSMTLDQKIERMGAIIKSDEFLPEFDYTVKQSALRFVDKMKHDASEISLRSLISVTKVAARGGNWERLAEYVLTAAN